MRREAELPEIYLYERNTRSVSYRDFVNKELILFSNADNERSIPSLVDGKYILHQIYIANTRVCMQNLKILRGR